MKDSVFYEGEHVRYIPGHAHGDICHADCENGIVTSTNEKYVFVRYGNKVASQATSPGDLRPIVQPTPGLETSHKTTGVENEL